MKKLILVFFIILSGCKTAIDETVLFIGDSTMMNSLPALNMQLLYTDSDTVGYELMTNAISGTAFSHADKGSQYWPGRSSAIFARSNVDTVVVALGQNDALLNHDSAQAVSMQGMIDAAFNLMQILSNNGARTVFWILPHAGRNALQDQQLNDVIWAIAVAQYYSQNVVLLNYTDYVTAHGYAMTEVLLTPDGNVHLNDIGNQLWAQMIDEALKSDAVRRGLIH